MLKREELDEIALEVASQKLDVLGYGRTNKFCLTDFCSEGVINAYAHALLIEVQKRLEVVGQVDRFERSWPAEGNFYIDAVLLDDVVLPIATKLTTLPLIEE